MGTPTTRHAHRAARGVLGAMIGFGALVGCGDGEDRLATLRTDPMATYALPSAVDTHTTEFAGGTSGVSSPSTVRNTFIVPAGGAADAIDEIADAAIGAGWTLNDREPNGFTGDRKIDGMSAQILIAGIEADDTVWVEVSSRDK